MLILIINRVILNGKSHEDKRYSQVLNNKTECFRLRLAPAQSCFAGLANGQHSNTRSCDHSLHIEFAQPRDELTGDSNGADLLNLPLLRVR